MKARFKGNGTQTITILRESIAFPKGEWISLPTIAFYKKIRSFPNLFDLVCEFDLEPLFKYNEHIRFQKKSIFCSHKPTIRSLDKLSILKRQAYLPERKTVVYNITSYSDTYLKGFVSLQSEVEILCQRTKGGIGDILMTIPTLQAISEMYENYIIDYACPKEYTCLLENIPFIRKVYSNDELVDVAKYDVVYDMTRKCIEYEGRTQPNVDLNRNEIFAKQVDIDITKLPRTKFYLSADEVNTGIFIDFKKSAQKQALVKRSTHNNKHLVIGVCCNSSATVRSYPYREILTKNLSEKYPDAKILYFQEKSDYITYKKNVFIFTGLKLREVAILISRCDVFIGPDTGLSHIASALRIPTVWLFTHVDGKIRTRGYDTSVFVQALPPACPSKTPCWYQFPCDPTQSQREHLDPPACALSLYPETVMAQVGGIIQKPSISFIVVCYNKINVTKECIKRILKVKKFNDELIVIDNGSTDSTKNYFEKLNVEKLHYIRNEKNTGCVEARNQAFKIVNGTFVWVLDNDQYISNHSLEFVKRTDGDIVGVEAWYINDSGFALNFERCGMFNYVGAGGMFAKLSTIKDVGFFDANYSPAWFEDPDFCISATEKGFTLGYCNNANIEHLAHTTNHSQKDFDSSKIWKRNRDYFVKKWKAVRFCKPLVSVVILTHNDSDSTIRCMDSILKTSDIKDVEIIVVDNGSNAPEASKLLHYQKPSVKYVFNKENLMVAAGRNIGAKKAKGEYILFLDNDMVLPTKWLERFVETMNMHNVVATAPKIIDIKEGGREFVRFIATVIEDGELKEIKEDVLMECDFLPGGALFVKRKLFELFDFDEKFVFGIEDYDWCMRVKKAGYKFINTPNSTFLHIKTQTGRTVTPYDNAERNRKGSSFIEDSVRLFLYRYENELPNLWKASGWLQWAIGRESNYEVQGVVDLFVKIREEVAKLHPDELLAERSC